MTGLKRFLMTSVVALGMVLGFSANAQADAPSNMDEFDARMSKEAKTPEGAASLWMDGVLLYTSSDSRELGRKIILAMTDSLPADFEKSMAHATFVNRMKDQPEIMRSYCAGSSPENGYKADIRKCELNIAGSKASNYEDDVWVIKLQSSGADSTRQIKLIKQGDIWKVTNYSSIYSGIKPSK